MVIESARGDAEALGFFGAEAELLRSENRWIVKAVSAGDDGDDHGAVQ